MLTEANIAHDRGSHWVCRDTDGYSVMVSGATHSRTDSTYALTPDGLSVAVARCNYLARRGSHAH